MNEDALLPVGFARLVETRDDIVFVRNVYLAEKRADLAGNFFAFFFVEIEDRYFDTGIRKCCGTGAAKA